MMDTLLYFCLGFLAQNKIFGSRYDKLRDFSFNLETNSPAFVNLPIDEAVLFCLQNVRNDRCARATDVLCHTDFCTLHLRFIAFPSQLLGNFHNLIYPVAPTGCPRAFSPPRVQTGTRPFGLISLSSPSFTPLPLSANPQASSDKARHDRKRIMQLEHINVILA